MKKFKNYIPISIQTCKGNVNINNIHIGDTILGFKGEEYEVKEIAVSPIENIYEVTYSDNRVDHYRLFELIYTGESITNIDTLIREDQGVNRYPLDNRKPSIGNIEQFPIDYIGDRIIEPLIPDPYIAGALLIHGQYEDRYINLPRHRSEVNAFFAHKYQLDFGYKIGYSDGNYFCYNGNSTDQLITWKEFFPKYHMLCKKTSSEIIPGEYQRAPINDRWQFIRGAFDMGYDKKASPDTCTIGCRHENRLMEVQKILWSLGILSTVTYDPNFSLDRKIQYRLDVHTKVSRYPEFFYYINFVEDMIMNEKRIINREPPFKLQICSIKPYAKGYSKNLILEKPRVLYLTDNFLPRVSA